MDGTLTLQNLLKFVQLTSRSMKLLNSVATVRQTKRVDTTMEGLLNLATAFFSSADEKNVFYFMVGRTTESML